MSVKKQLCLLLTLLLLAGSVFAADTSIPISYEAPNIEEYTLTVPATLAPGGSGEVTLSGAWGSARKVIVTADESVTVTNSISRGDSKTLAITFHGINQLGNDTQEQTIAETVSVEGITNALFGTWSGAFNYAVSVLDATDDTGSSPANVSIDITDPEALELTVGNYDFSTFRGVTMDGEEVDPL